MHGRCDPNLQVGTVNPIADIVAAVKAARPSQSIAFHCDTSQAVGKIPVDVAAMGVDFACIAGHKLYAPKVGPTPLHAIRV